MRTIIRSFMLSLVLILPIPGTAELVVIVNPDSGVKTLEATDLINIFMGRYQQLSPGLTAFPVDMASQRPQFYKQLIDKTVPEINSYWARLVISGRASPPRQVQDASEVLEIVSNNRGAIGYLERSMVDDRVHIVFSFPTMAHTQK